MMLEFIQQHWVAMMGIVWLLCMTLAIKYDEDNQ